MKKILSFITFMCLTTALTFAAEPNKDEFAFDESQISSEFGQLNKIENYVQDHDVTLDELKAENSKLVSGIDLSTDASEALAVDDLPLNIPAFWWGCVLAVLGVILVYVLTDQDKEQTKQALIGCLVFAGVYVLIWVILAASTSAFLWF
ncbi:hypothetical protein LAG90_11340 [Marinilongibacter aquaticus]|uniref:hypothetical protein n=1 Tax=Marinilongibacter aquaticus TaxID=2975157 RepID=UPI0021BD0113|nr:hypothetical protein [Marinilongibacter aquaticus]UBM57413.1 hypothetical protein LAG90_11340 [Marinilongibacter aquaticus]